MRPRKKTIMKNQDTNLQNICQPIQIANFQTASKEIAEKHLQFLSGQKTSREVFQIYPDSPKCLVHPRILIGTLDEHFDTLVAMNRAGCAISVVVNQTDLRGRAGKNIIGIRAFFTDDDNNLNVKIPLDPPSFKVKSKNGYHKYYIVRNFDLKDFTPMQKCLAEIAGTDPKVCDLARPMRLAGFYHMKNPNNPFFVNLESDFLENLEKSLK